ncbi:MAG TPA: site-2 protease family protein [Planctomycetota bacterium]|nr:site-2 protease family protein [Planctomycetota bacterium]
MSYLLVFAVVQVLILLHEAGHFWAARALGIPIARFSVGVGPRLWSFWRGDTEYVLAAFPLGGYVLPYLVEPDDYYRIPLGRRILFALGGPLANLLLALPLFLILNVIRDGFTLHGALVAPFVQTVEFSLRFLAAIPQLFQQPEAVSGVVGIVHQGGEYVRMDPARGIFFAIAMTLNLGIFNLLPLPILDGGKIVLDVIHRFRPGIVRYASAISIVGIALLLAIFLYTTTMDLRRLMAWFSSGSMPS